MNLFDSVIDTPCRGFGTVTWVLMLFLLAVAEEVVDEEEEEEEELSLLL